MSGLNDKKKHFSVFFRVKKFGGYTNFIYFCTGFQNDEDKSSTESRGKVN